MESLYINDYPDQINYPVVDFNYNTGICEISGESYMEDSYVFYESLLNWFKDYFDEKRPITFNIKLIYFNTSSSRLILELLDLVKAYIDNGGKAEINWFYKKKDPDMKREISDFKDETNLEINILPFED